MRRWLEVAEIVEGAAFRRVWIAPAGRDGRQTPLARVDVNEIDPRTAARIIQNRAAGAGFSSTEVSDYSLKRGAMTTEMGRGVHPTKLKRLGRHKSYAMVDEYIEVGDPFEGPPLDGAL